MSRLVIRKVGPIENLDIELNKVNVFIGPQGSGKSTVAKIVSFCSWLEKVNDSTFRAVADGLIKRLTAFHHMAGYFTPESELLYEGDNVAFVYNWKSGPVTLPNKFSDSSKSLREGESVFYSAEKTVNPKVAYIPAERNFVSAVPSLRNYSDDPKEVSVWSIDEGCLRGCDGEIDRTIQDEHGLIRKNYFNDVISPRGVSCSWKGC